MTSLTNKPSHVTLRANEKQPHSLLCRIRKYAFATDTDTDALLRNLHQTEVLHSTSETRALESRGFVLGRYCKTPFAAGDTKEHIDCLEWRVWMPGLQPRSDFKLFPAQKSALSGCHFRSNEEVRSAVKKFLRSVGTGFHQDGFFQCRWRICGILAKSLYFGIIAKSLYYGIIAKSLYFGIIAKS
ncbi:hypothetical protein AVEN_92000-1, partial [Araneus ventricosus]